MAALGLVASPWAVFCLPAAMLVSFAFGGMGMFGTCYMRSWQDFDLVSLAIVPLFLFSGVFYPLSLYPEWLRVLVSLTPLYQGVALLRGLDTGVVGPLFVVHACYLALFGVVGLMGCHAASRPPLARLSAAVAAGGSGPPPGGAGPELWAPGNGAHASDTISWKAD